MGFFLRGGSLDCVEENFMKEVSKWFSFFKMRASYGKVGNDGIISTPRFVYMPQIGNTSVNMELIPMPV